MFGFVFPYCLFYENVRLRIVCGAALAAATKKAPGGKGSVGGSGNKVSFVFSQKPGAKPGSNNAKRKNLRSFYFAALQTTSAYVLRSNNAIVYNSDLLYVCIVRAWCLTVTVAHFIAGQFRFPANAANSRHISHLQIQIQI